MKFKDLTRFKRETKRLIVFSFAAALVISSLIFIFNQSFLIFAITFVSIISLILISVKVRDILKKADRIKKIENVFPDFLQLMSSNLRAGMTIDRALLLGSRPEFSPLDVEILNTGKDITVGKNMSQALSDLSKRIGSPKIEKIILLINSGIAALIFPLHAFFESKLKGRLSKG